MFLTHSLLGTIQHIKYELTEKRIADLIQTVEHNLTAADDELRYQRKVHYPNVTPAAARAFDQMAAARAQQLLEDLNEWLAAHYDDGADEGPRQSVSLGIYFFQDQSPEKKE